MRGDVDAVFSALSDERRRAVVELLASRGSATATELSGELPVTRQAVAKHLASLDGAGLVSVTRRGREARYELTPQPLSEALDWIERVGGQWDRRLAALRRHLADPESFGLVVRQPDGAVFGERPVGVVRDLPRMAVGIHEDAGFGASRRSALPLWRSWRRRPRLPPGHDRPRRRRRRCRQA